MKLFKLSEIVRSELESHPETRNSDKMLIYSVYKEHFGVTGNEKWAKVILNEDLPSFESIRRCRQKLQVKHEELRAVESIELIRLANQRDFIEYAIGEELWI